MLTDEIQLNTYIVLFYDGNENRLMRVEAVDIDQATRLVTSLSDEHDVTLSWKYNEPANLSDQFRMYVGKQVDWDGTLNDIPKLSEIEV